MSPDTKLQVASLADLTTDQLSKKYERLSGEKCRSRNRRYLHRRVAWMLQAKDEGGLSERALLRAGVIADESLVRVTPPRQKTKKEPESTVPTDWDHRLPPPGNLIERRYKGRMVHVLVLTEGFEYEGERYKSLTAIARVISGTHCDGFLFFKLGPTR